MGTKLSPDDVNVSNNGAQKSSPKATCLDLPPIQKILYKNQAKTVCYFMLLSTKLRGMRSRMVLASMTPFVP